MFPIFASVFPARPVNAESRSEVGLLSLIPHVCVEIRFVERTNLHYSDSLNELIHIVRSKLRSSNKFLKSLCNFKGHHDEKGYEVTV